jgi:hypothetical protein
MFTVFVAALVAIVLVLGWHIWGRSAARVAAEQWLIQHRYRIREIRAPWFRGGGFVSSLYRNTPNAYEFEAIVEDSHLGRTARVLLRVGADRFGQLTGEIEAVTDEILRSDGNAPPLDRLAHTQLEILQRVAAGETGFHVPRLSDGEDAEFNELVEHVIALSRRGMVKCDAPTVDVRDSGQYTAIDNIMLTTAGRAWLESRA